MIKIIIKEKQIVIKGHANYDELGKDIVCASVSSIVITTINAILRIDNNAIKYSDENGIIINIMKDEKVINELINNLIDLLEELKSQYPKYIEIRRC